MGKRCCVPHCHTGYRKYNEKHPMYGVPKDDFFLSKWQDIIARADRPITPNDCVCQKHFQPEDFTYCRAVKGELEKYKVPKLKPDAVPSIFPETPESIHGTVKKRRKLSIDDQQYKLQKEKKEQGANNNNDSAIEKIKSEDEIKKEEILDSDNISSQNSAIALCDTVRIEEVNIKTEDTIKLEREEYTGPKLYKCDQCNYASKWANNLQTHQTKHLEGEQYYFRCEMCPSFKTKWHGTYKNHIKTKHSLGPQKVYTCDLCDFKTKVKICLRRHLDRHKRGVFDRKFCCLSSKCAFKCRSNEELEMHVKSRHISKKIQCGECLFQTNFKKEILKHIKLVHCTGDEDGSISSAPFTTSPKKSQKITKRSNVNTSIKKLQKCTKCSFESDSETLLLEHIFKHNYDEIVRHNSQKSTDNFTEPLDNFKCRECDFKCNLKPEFIKHTLMHRNISVETMSRR